MTLAERRSEAFRTAKSNIMRMRDPNERYIEHRDVQIAEDPVQPKVVEPHEIVFPRFNPSYTELMQQKPAKYDTTNLIRLVKDQLKMRSEIEHRLKVVEMELYLLR